MITITPEEALFNAPLLRPVEGVVEPHGYEAHFGPFGPENPMRASLRASELGVLPVCPYGEKGQQIKFIEDRGLYILKEVEVWEEDGEYLWALHIEPMPKAVCTVLCCDDLGEKVVAVSREGVSAPLALMGVALNHLRWGLPGGKVDSEDPSIVAAAIRELREETGMVVDPHQLRVLFQAVCPGKVTYFTTTFIYMGTVSFPERQQNAEGSMVITTPWGVLMNPTTSPFAEYNSHLKKALDHFLTGK